MTPINRVVSPQEAKEKMQSLEDFILLDVRRLDEFNESHIKGAVLIPAEELSSRVLNELPSLNIPIFVYCRSGRRSAAAAADLASLGFMEIYDFGGILDWPFEKVTRGLE